MKDIMVFWLSVAVIVFILFVTTGCAQKTVYVDRVVTVKVPVKCDIKEVLKAQQRENSAVTLADILRERDELRVAVEGCR